MPQPSAHELDKRLSVLEDRFKLFGTIVALLLAGVGFWFWYVTSNLIAIKQQLADGGNKQLVTELTNPKSSQQLEANLSTVIAQVQTARARNQPPNSTKVDQLSKAVGGVLNQRPSLIRGWQAAEELISFRSMPPQENPIRCRDIPHSPPKGSPELGTIIESTFFLEGCTISLDGDDADFITKRAEAVARAWGKPGAVPVELSFVHIIYSGGDLPKVPYVQFENCTFEFRSPSVPTRSGENAVRQLLAASDIKNVRVVPQNS